MEFLMKNPTKPSGYREWSREFPPFGFYPYFLVDQGIRNDILCPFGGVREGVLCLYPCGIAQGERLGTLTAMDCTG